MNTIEEQVEVLDLYTGEVVKDIQYTIPKELLSTQPNAETIKQVITWQRNKVRSGSHKTKTISEVSGTGRKPHAQKGSGRARHGTLRSVQMRGGATVHGPMVRKYGVCAPPKKIRRLAIKYLLVDKMLNNKLIVVNNFGMDSISTKKCKHFFNQILVKSALVCIDQQDKNFILSSKNIPNVKSIIYEHINAYDIVRHEYFIISIDSIHALEKVILQ